MPIFRQNASIRKKYDIIIFPSRSFMKHEKEIQIFSLSFLDTFCCALGAMIFLFILNSQILTETVKKAALRYQAKAEEAWQERTKADKEKKLAIEFRDKAIVAQNLAEQSRSQAEQAAQQAAKSQAEAINFQQQAVEQRDIAIQSQNQAREAQINAEKALQDVKVAQQQIQIAQKALEERNQQLIAVNNTLREIVNENKTNDQKMKDLSQKYDSLLQAYQALEKSQQDNQIALINAQGEKDNLQNRFHQTSQQYQQIQQQLKQATEQLKIIQNQNTQYQTRLDVKNQESQNYIQATQKQQEIIKTYESRIQTLQQKLAQNDEKSIFGIQLKYKRIVLLVDRSQSIVQNSWKSLMIQTCSDILQHCEVDEFAIIAFSSDMRFYPSRRGVSTSGNIEEKKKAIAWIANDMPFGGATHLLQALRIAYEDYGNLDAIFILTDGLPEEQGRTSEYLQEMIVKDIQYQARQNKTKIIAISIGYPPTNAQQYIEIYKYLHRISALTDGQYLGK